MAQAQSFVEREMRRMVLPAARSCSTSYHGYANSVQTVSITNGARFENQGQVWFGISGLTTVDEENQPGIRVVMTINDGHMDLTGGDEYALDNDNFLIERRFGLYLQT